MLKDKKYSWLPFEGMHKTPHPKLFFVLLSQVLFFDSTQIANCLLLIHKYMKIDTRGTFYNSITLLNLVHQISNKFSFVCPI